MRPTGRETIVPLSGIVGLQGCRFGPCRVQSKSGSASQSNYDSLNRWSKNRLLCQSFATLASYASSSSVTGFPASSTRSQRRPLRNKNFSSPLPRCSFRRDPANKSARDQASGRLPGFLLLFAPNSLGHREYRLPQPQLDFHDRLGGFLS